ncbi:MAG: hypothetical protein PVF83_15710 [Anaerolineales bacterium]
MKKFHIIIITFILLGIFTVPGTAFAKAIDVPVMDDKVIFGGSFTLESGETLEGSLIIMGGVVLIEEDSFVGGDVVVFGGNLTVKGEIDQNLVAIGGVVTLEETAVVYGDLVAPASVFRREEGAQVYGQIITDTGSLDIQIPDVPDIPEIPDVPGVPEVPDIPISPFTYFDQFSYALSPITSILWGIVRAFAFSAVAIVVVLFVPEHAKRTSNALVTNPILSGGLGILSVIIAFPLMIVFIITIIGPIFISMILCLGLFMGWVAIGLEVGRRIAEALSREWSYAVQAGIGTFTLSIVIGSIGLVLWDIISFLLVVGIGSIGLGAVLLTRFGTQEYFPAESQKSHLVESNVIQKEETKTEVDEKE